MNAVLKSFIKHILIDIQGYIFPNSRVMYVTLDKLFKFLDLKNA